MKRLALVIALLLSATAAHAQTTVFNCLSGFTATAGACQASTNTGGGTKFWFGPNAEGSFMGSALDILPTGATHEAGSAIYQTPVNVQAFTSTFLFVPNGQNVSFMLENSNNNPI